jgi:SAM-dependent methyltransferase
MTAMGDRPSNTFARDTVVGFVLGHAILAAWSAGMWAVFERDPDGVLDLDDLAAARGLDTRLARRVAEYLVRRDVLAPAGEGRFALAPAGRELVTGEWLPFFVFYAGGYGPVLGAASRLVTGAARYGADVVRDDEHMALGSELISRTNRTGTYEMVFARAAALDPGSIVDVGCGTGRFLVELMRRTWARRGVGVDVSAAACTLARQALAHDDLHAQVTVVESDARRLLEVCPELEGQVDLMTAMFLVHELFSTGFDQAAADLARLAPALRAGTGRLLVLDKHTDAIEPAAAGGPFHLTEFKLIHDLTDQVLCTAAQWRAVFDAAGFEIVDERVLHPMTGNILFECRVRPASRPVSARPRPPR